MERMVSGVFVGWMRMRQPPLERGVRITDYQLRSGRYTLKSAKIPGFSGHLTLSSSLSAPMQEVWNLLLVFSTLAASGSNTLGMGRRNT